MNAPKVPTPEDALSQLGWLVDMGADEVVGEEAIDRFASSAARMQPARGQETEKILAKARPQAGACRAAAKHR